jgi:hypothetical protein
MKDKENKKIDGTLLKTINDVKKLKVSNDFLTDIHWEDYIKRDGSLVDWKTEMCKVYDIIHTMINTAHLLTFDIYTDQTKNILDLTHIDKVFYSFLINQTFDADKGEVTSIIFELTIVENSVTYQFVDKINTKLRNIFPPAVFKIFPEAALNTLSSFTHFNESNKLSMFLFENEMINDPLWRFNERYAVAAYSGIIYVFPELPQPSINK